ncbi:cytochrome P450 [uncultured Enterovirga sp.]|uniref:cytochrome P450 n=1 Tax=uncultured Enterovirga sp. TaxID=2026352 RepID=UPI0035CBEE18
MTEAAFVISSDLNPMAGAAFNDPYPVYTELRAMGPVIWLNSLGVWGVFREPVVRQVVSDWQNFGSRGGGGVSNYLREPPWREPSVVFEVDPPDHTRTRAVFARVLSPGVLAKLKAGIEAEAERLVREVVDQGRFDAVTDLAKPFPMKVLPDALGLSPENRENLIVYNAFVRKGRAHRWRETWTEADEAEGNRIQAWVEQNCRREALSPDGFGARMYAAADAGEVTHEEAANLIRSFLAAGIETTMNGIAHTINLLIQHPDQWAIVREDPTKVRAAFDEMLRYDSAIQIIARNTVRDVVFEGTPMAAQDKVIAFIGSANRDPSRWPDPDRFDITRSTTGHLALGTGIHGCVGQMMARMEATALLGALARAVETIEAAGPPVWRMSGARGLERLPVTVKPRRPGSVAA